jgi:hypothetical protein
MNSSTVSLPPAFFLPAQDQIQLLTPSHMLCIPTNQLTGLQVVNWLTAGKLAHLTGLHSQMK